MSKKTSIGGQALIEGIMMKGPEKTAMAVRTPSGEIDITYLSARSPKEVCPLFGVPVIRGVANFIATLVQGYKALMLSADKSGFTELEEAKENEKPHTLVVLLWCILLIVLPIALVFSESSMGNIQSISIISAFPIGIIMILMIWKELVQVLFYLKY